MKLQVFSFIGTRAIFLKLKNKTSDKYNRSESKGKVQWPVYSNVAEEN